MVLVACDCVGAVQLRYLATIVGVLWCYGGQCAERHYGIVCVGVVKQIVLTAVGGPIGAVVPRAAIEQVFRSFCVGPGGGEIWKHRVGELNTWGAFKAASIADSGSAPTGAPAFSRCRRRCRRCGRRCCSRSTSRRSSRRSRSTWHVPRRILAHFSLVVSVEHVTGGVGVLLTRLNASGVACKGVPGVAKAGLCTGVTAGVRGGDAGEAKRCNGAIFEDGRDGIHV